MSCSGWIDSDSNTGDDAADGIRYKFIYHDYSMFLKDSYDEISWVETIFGISNNDKYRECCTCYFR